MDRQQHVFCTGGSEGIGLELARQVCCKNAAPTSSTAPETCRTVTRGIAPEQTPWKGQLALWRNHTGPLCLTQL